MMKFLFRIFICLLMTLPVTAQQPAFITDSLDRYIERGLSDWQVPGLAVVIVKDGQVIVAKGYGVKNIQSKEPVVANTLFYIASNTKLFTGTALAQLEYQKKLSLNDKISKYYPAFKLYDKNASDMVTIKDMLAHRIGTKTFQGDFTFWNSHLGRSEIMNRMRLLKPINPFRQDYGYCNSCFLTAGQIVPKVTRVSWEQYVADSIFAPLGMSNSYAATDGIQNRVQNIATPYTTAYTNRLTEVPYDRWDNMGPAASIVSNVKDLGNWLQFQLDSGRFNGKRVMPFAVLQKTRDINIVTGSRKSFFYPTHIRGYGLGVFNGDYYGRQVYWHTGGAAGMVSNVCFVPEERLGIAILTNNDNQSFFESLRYQLLDAYLGVPYVNRSQQMLAGHNDEMRTQVELVEAWETRVLPNSRGLGVYAGTYTHPIYGSLAITVQGNQLALKFNSHPNLTATMREMDDNLWLLRYDNIEYGVFTTRFTKKGNKVASVEIKANDFVEFDPYVFTKK